MDIKINELLSPNQYTYKQLANVLEPLDFNEYNKFSVFWNDWLNNKISGSKITIVAQDTRNLIGIVRFWHSPYVDKWLIEGLYVLHKFRKHGIAKQMLYFGLQILKDKYVKEVFVHIKNTNYPSKNLFKKLGFFINNDFEYINSVGVKNLHIGEYIMII